MLPFSLLGFGFLLGVKHAFDADHIAAVSAIAAKHKFKSVKSYSLAGMFWGFGHTISLLCAGLAILLLKIAIPEKIALSFEFIVGIMLVILGINVLLTISKNKIHFHRHKHEKEEHTHLHSHKLTKLHGHKHRLFHQSLFIGLIHGLAGSAVLTLLVLTTIKSVWLGLAYILVFGIGSMAGMILISSIIFLPFTLIPDSLQRTQKILRISAGSISMIIGLTMMYNIGIAGGLLI